MLLKKILPIMKVLELVMLQARKTPPDILTKVTCDVCKTKFEFGFGDVSIVFASDCGLNVRCIVCKSHSNYTVHRDVFSMYNTYQAYTATREMIERFHFSLLKKRAFVLASSLPRLHVYLIPELVRLDAVFSEQISPDVDVFEIFNMKALADIAMLVYDKMGSIGHEPSPQKT